MGQAAWACRDQCTPSMRATCARCARDLGVCAQLRTPCERSAHDLTWCSALFCLLFRVTVWTLFMSTVHRVKKKYTIFKNFLVYDLKYKLFILKLL